MRSQKAGRDALVCRLQTGRRHRFLAAHGVDDGRIDDQLFRAHVLELASWEHFTAFWPLEAMWLNAIPIILPSAAVDLGLIRICAV